MHIQISLHDGVPIYRQIVTQVKYLVASRQLSSDDELPPIRTLARQLQVNPNTVAKAYQELETDGVVFKRQGSGTFVTDRSSPLARREQRRILADRADALLAEARQMNFSFDELLGLLESRHAVMLKSQSQEAARGR